MSVKLNLGCGQSGLSGWDNIDNSPSVILSKMPFLRTILWRLKLLSDESYKARWASGVRWRDLSKGLDYPDEAVDKIYSSHMLEHMQKENAERLLKECHRILKKGGIMRLVVPDLVFHCRRYLDRVAVSGAGRGPHDEFLFNVYGAYLDKRRKGANHSYMYDWPTLQTLLSEVGFERVIRQEFRTGLDPELCALDSRPEDSLHIDIIK